MIPPLTHRLMAKNQNSLGLKFFEPDWMENFILNEIEQDYRFDELKLDHTSFVLDIGGHVGVTAIYLAKKYGCIVNTYEPTSRNYAKLCENIKLNNVSDLVSAYHVAVTKDGRNVEIGIGDDNWGANDIYGVHTKNTETVESFSIRDVIPLEDEVSLIKMDCELAEFELLEDLSVLKYVKAIRGEFHSQVYGDIENLLARVIAIVPNTRVTMQRSAEQKIEMRKEKKQLAKIAARKKG